MVMVTKNSTKIHGKTTTVSHCLFSEKFRCPLAYINYDVNYSQLATKRKTNVLQNKQLKADYLNICLKSITTCMTTLEKNKNITFPTKLLFVRHRIRRLR